MAVHNLYNRETLLLRLSEEGVKRSTISFYRYVRLTNAGQLRNELYRKLDELKVFGRIYLANEGINAQFSLPEGNVCALVDLLDSYTEFKNMPLKFAVEENNRSFLKLKIKVRPKLVADGLSDGEINLDKKGAYLNAKEFNAAMDHPGSIVVDVRNHYESAVGRFKGAVCPDADTFREELPMLLKLLEDKKEKKVLLYCTGGIRCEKAGAYLRHHGYNYVYQLFGGIIEYAKQVRENGMESKFIGKNFVFDERMSERVTDDVVAQCHQCGNPCDTQNNCSNDYCHLLFIQCGECAKKYHACCSEECKDVVTGVSTIRVHKRQKAGNAYRKAIHHRH